jgi:hypothetical protein
VIVRYCQTKMCIWTVQKAVLSKNVKKINMNAKHVRKLDIQIPIFFCCGFWMTMAILFRSGYQMVDLPSLDHFIIFLLLCVFLASYVENIFDCHRAFTIKKTGQIVQILDHGLKSITLDFRTYSFDPKSGLVRFKNLYKFI